MTLGSINNSQAMHDLYRDRYAVAIFLRKHLIYLYMAYNSWWNLIQSQTVIFSDHIFLYLKALLHQSIVDSPVKIKEYYSEARMEIMKKENKAQLLRDGVSFGALLPGNHWSAVSHEIRLHRLPSLDFTQVSSLTSSSTTLSSFRLMFTYRSIPSSEAL